MPLLDDAGVDATVLVQTRSSAEEPGVPRDRGGSARIAASIAWTDLTDPGVADDIAGLQSAAGRRRLVAIRHQVHDEPDPEWLPPPGRPPWPASGRRRGLLYDLLVRAREMPAALDVVRSMPDLRFVIDHLGKPPIRDGHISPWAERIAPFGALPNAWCKL